MPARHLKLGQAGEDAAAELLTRHGYAIRHRNWTSGHLELDMVAENDGMLVFVEVKTRGQGSRGQAVEAMSRTKAERLIRAATAYLNAFELWDAPCRFDLVAVESGPGGLRTEHVTDIITLDEAPW